MHEPSAGSAHNNLNFPRPESGMMRYLIEQRKRYQIERQYAEKWTEDKDLQETLTEQQTYIAKLATIREKAETSIESERIDRSNFAEDSHNQITVFDCSVGAINKKEKLRVLQTNDSGDVFSTFPITYHNLKAIDDKIVKERTPTFTGSHLESRSYSQAMEQIFKEVIKIVLGDEYEVRVPDLVDDYQHATDLLIIKKNKSGEVENVFTIDLFVGIDEVQDQEFLLKKMLESYSRISAATPNNIHYVETIDKDGKVKRFSATNVSSLILPIGSNNLEKIAEAIYKNDLSKIDIHLLRSQILKCFRAQIKAKEELANLIDPKEVTKEVNGVTKTIIYNNRPKVVASLKR